MLLLYYYKLLYYYNIYKIVDYIVIDIYIIEC